MSMKELLIVFFVLSLVLLILIFPFKSRLMCHFDLVDKKGFYSFKAWRIKILCGRIYLDENDELKIENKQNAIKDRYKDAYMKRFALNILKNLEVKKVELFFKGGIKKDSFSSAMLCGGVKSLVNIIYANLSQKFENVRLFEDISPVFSEDYFELTFDFVAVFSILQIICALIIAKVEQAWEVKS